MVIVTPRLCLRLLDQEDELQIVKWRNQKEIIDNLFSYKGITLSEHRMWFEKYLKDDSRLEFVIQIKDGNKKIGTIGLSSIDYRNQKAEYGVLIGELDEQGKGYAKEASVAILNYGFSELNLQKIYLRVFSDNTPAVIMYKKLGFVEEGILKDEIYKNGRYKDVVHMAIFKNYWREKND